MTVSEKSEEYGRNVEQELLATGLRVDSDFRSETLNAKIYRGEKLDLIPYMLVVGPRDEVNKTVSVRDRVDGPVGAMSIDEAIAKLKAEVAAKTVRKTYGRNAGLGERVSDHEY